MKFITEHKGEWGVEPICRELQVAPSSYYAAIRRPVSARRRRDETLQVAIRRVWDEHRQVYDADSLASSARRSRIASGLPISRTSRPTSDQGVQHLAIRYTERLAEAGAVPSVGSRGDSYDNALTESFNGLYKTELIRHADPWQGLDDVEYATDLATTVGLLLILAEVYVAHRHA